MITRRRLLQSVGPAAALALPFFELISPQRVRAADGVAQRVIVMYFPDGVAGPSQDGEPSLWHPTGSEFDFVLPEQLAPLEARRDDCVFFRGLTLGPTDSGSHPGGAKKLLTATDGGNGVSIDHVLANGVGADAPWRHLYLGVAANADGASGDKLISYASAGQSITPQDDPRTAFELLFGRPGDVGEPQVDPVAVSVIDGVLDDMDRLRTRLGNVEQSKLDLHLQALREVELRIKGGGAAGVADCSAPSLSADVPAAELYSPARFPEVMKAQIDLMVLAMACGLSRVGVLQASHHTSDLLMSQFPATEMYDPGYDMRSHQASHYGPAHDPAKKEFVAYVQQVRWFVAQFAALLEALRAVPELDGTMLDHSIVLLCTEVCDGNTHLHDDMPFVLAGRAGGRVTTGRLATHEGVRHGGLLAAIGQAMGAELPSFGDAGTAAIALG
ncbi:MAG: DUF1552 domain-containing protein [Nannocystaceae bacterium]|nr:DUF1552 domain-containing protein [Nannocystaceae bacterium]